MKKRKRSFKWSDIYRRFERLVPDMYETAVARQLTYANLEVSMQKWVGFTLAFGFLLGAVIAFDLWAFFGITPAAILVVLVSISILFHIFSYVYLTFLSDWRAQAIEAVLPDALQLIAANIRAGLTPDRAILLSAKKEFGLLEDEIKEIGTKTVAGKALNDALSDMENRVKSKILERVVELINEGMKAGGELASLLEQIAEDIRMTQSLQKEIKASVTMYVMFIVFSAGFAAPVLFSISNYFVIVSSEMWGGATSGAQGSYGAAGAPTMKSIELPPNLMRNFSLACIIITAVFSGLIIGEITKGNAKEGISYSFILVVLALTMYFGAQYAVNSLFRTLIQM